MTNLRVLFRREAVEGEGGVGVDVMWAAIGLEHDIVASGSTIFEAYWAFKQTVRAEMRSLTNRSLTIDAIPPAPIEYFNEYEEAKKHGLVTICKI